jgi:branched-chain amino acid transport system substrate-binding protein
VKPRAAAIGLCVLALSGCGGGNQAPTPQLHAGQETVDIYASLPLEGPQSAEMHEVVDGMRLALHQRGGTADFYHVDFDPLNDAYRNGKWDAALVASNAVNAATDRLAVYYIGDWASGASEISIPILNQAGVPQVSPASTYIGLTSDQLGAGPNEPAKYFPSGTRTFLRLVPSGAVEAGAVLTALKQQLRCRRVAIGHDTDVDGSSLATLIDLRAGVDVVSDLPAVPGSAGFAGWLASLKRSRLDCVVWAGALADGGTKVASAVHQELPSVKILGTDGVCTRSWTTGLPPSADPLLWCTAPTPDLAATPAGRKFLADYKARYGILNPDPAAVYGYEAMKLGLDTIAALGAQGNLKADVLSALFATRGRSSPIGTYGFNRNGEITLGSYGLYQFRGGAPVFSQPLAPSRVP